MIFLKTKKETSPPARGEGLFTPASSRILEDQRRNNKEIVIYKLGYRGTGAPRYRNRLWIDVLLVIRSDMNHSLNTTNVSPQRYNKKLTTIEIVVHLLICTVIISI